MSGQILAQLGGALASLGALLVPAAVVGIVFALAWRRLTR